MRPSPDASTGKGLVTTASLRIDEINSWRAPPPIGTIHATFSTGAQWSIAMHSSGYQEGESANAGPTVAQKSAALNDARLSMVSSIKEENLGAQAKIDFE